MKNFKILISGLLMSGATILSITCLQAQISLGAGLAYGGRIEKLGLNLRGTYDVDDKLVAMPGVNFYFKDKSINGVEINYFSIDLNAGYRLIRIADQIDVIPLGGLNFFRGSVTGNASGFSIQNTGTQLGVDLGVEVQIENPISDWHYFGAFKSTIGGIDQLTVKAGVLYGF